MDLAIGERCEGVKKEGCIRIQKVVGDYSASGMFMPVERFENVTKWSGMSLLITEIFIYPGSLGSPFLAASYTCFD